VIECGLLKISGRGGIYFLNETCAFAMNLRKKPTFSKPILFID
jgi:hypothetical protein